MQTPNFVDPPVISQPEQLCGFTLDASYHSQRLSELRFPADIVTAFLQQIAQWPVQALEYKSLLRFEIARLLDTLCEGTLRPTLINTLLDRGLGALLIKPEGLNEVSQADEMVKFATAVAHLTGRSNFDAMSGQFYARFVVKNVDHSDSYLRQPHRVMELHNDGTYVAEQTDYVLMMKIDEQNMTGGNSLLLHLDDWQDCATFFASPLSRRDMRWTAPPSKNAVCDIFHPVFGTDSRGRPTLRYIDQFVQPKDLEEGSWLYQLGESLEHAPAKISLPVPVGSFLLINNAFWLHGRDKFTAHPDLRRELMRQRGYFCYPQNGYQHGQ